MSTIGTKKKIIIPSIFFKNKLFKNLLSINKK